VIELKSPGEIEVIQRAGRIAAEVHDLVADRIAPGVDTRSLDEEAEAYIRDCDGATPAFKGLYGFPATLCTSRNEEVVHGIPSADCVLEEGDILSVDVGVELEGFFADAARTLGVGELDPEVGRLLETTRAALDAGIAEARAGGRLGSVGAAIQGVVEEAGFSVVRELVGHGVGRSPHEDPQVPNYGKRGTGRTLEEGLVVAIEPMVNLGGREIRTLEDGWTVVTADGSRSAHFEHTVAVTADGPVVLTERRADVMSRRK
jgi:methionyl aminopeptidase